MLSYQHLFCLKQLFLLKINMITKAIYNHQTECFKSFLISSTLYWFEFDLPLKRNQKVKKFGKKTSRNGLKVASQGL